MNDDKEEVLQNWVDEYVRLREATKRLLEAAKEVACRTRVALPGDPIIALKDAIAAAEEALK